MNDVNSHRLFGKNELKILGLPGSLRRHSLNRRLLNAAVEYAPAGISVEVLGDLTSIPLFNEDVEAASGYGPESVCELRRRIGAVDGLLIATPEYNQSVPGVLKNMLDWLSRPGPEEVLIGKPVAIIGASGGRWGTRLAQASLRQMLQACETLVLPGASLYAKRADALFDDAGRLTDRATQEKLATVLVAFADWIKRINVPSSRKEPEFARTSDMEEECSA